MRTTVLIAASVVVKFPPVLVSANSLVQGRNLWCLECVASHFNKQLTGHLQSAILFPVSHFPTNLRSTSAGCIGLRLSYPFYNSITSIGIFLNFAQSFVCWFLPSLSPPAESDLPKIHIDALLRSFPSDLMGMTRRPAVQFCFRTFDTLRPSPLSRKLFVYPTGAFCA